MDDPARLACLALVAVVWAPARAAAQVSTTSRAAAGVGDAKQSPPPPAPPPAAPTPGYSTAPPAEGTVAGGATASTAGTSSSPSAIAFTKDRVTLTGGPEWGSNDLDFGVGLRLGYTLPMSLYLGVAADYWLGTSQDVNFGGSSIKSSVHGWDVLGDIGYDFGATPKVVLRPFGGFGIFGAFGETCITSLGAPTTMCTKVSTSKGIGSFGGQVLVDVGGLNLGGELRLLFYQGDTAALIGGRIGAAF